jgi:flagellin
MTVINTNNAATITANALTKNERAMSQAMERLSTGQRINSAGDDAAGLAISSRMTSQINGLNMAVRNANDAISMVQTADGAMVEVESMLQRMRELAVQAASGTYSATDRSALNTEFQALGAEITRVGGNTQWNGTNILDGVATSGAQSFQVGANASQTIDHTFTTIGKNSSTATTPASPGQAAGAGQKQISTITIAGTADGDVLTGTINGQAFAFTMSTHDHASAGFASTVAAHDGTGAIVVAKANATTFTFTGSANAISFTIDNLRVGNGIGAAVGQLDLTTASLAGSAITSINTQITSLNSSRASAGAAINRLEYASDNLANVAQNTSASRSRILDADYASETTELARTQIIQQAGTAMLSQANQAAQSVLALLR